MLKCTDCKLTKPISQFGRDRAQIHRGGFAKRCKPCAKIRSSSYYRRHREKVKARMNARSAERRVARGGSAIRMCSWPEGCDRPATTQRHYYCSEHRRLAKDLRLQRRGQMSEWRLALARELDARREERRRQTGEDARRKKRYDAAYVAKRKEWEPVVEAGGVRCHDPHCLLRDARGRPGLIVGNEWDLGHAPDGSIRGPEHRRCNRATARREKRAA